MKIQECLITQNPYEQPGNTRLLLT